MRGVELKHIRWDEQAGTHEKWSPKEAENGTSCVMCWKRRIYAGYRTTAADPDRTYQHHKAQRTPALTFYRRSRPPKGQPSAGVSQAVQPALPTETPESRSSVGENEPVGLPRLSTPRTTGKSLPISGACLRNKLSSRHISNSRRSKRTHGSSAFFQSEQAELSRQ